MKITIYVIFYVRTVFLKRMQLRLDLLFSATSHEQILKYAMFGKQAPV